MGKPTDGARSDGRRTETRDRINQVALDVFIERGYDGSTLREIADRLGVTRPALYYHVKNKEELLANIHQELAESLDPIIDAAVQAGPGSSTRNDLLTRMAGLIDGRWGLFTSFAQANEAAMRTLEAAAAFRERMEVLTVILAPTDDIEGRMRARLALNALFMASARDRPLGGTDRERMKVALSMALRLVDDGPVDKPSVRRTTTGATE
ncbi:MAG: TetR/AcrR family transcriptional regulator [Candidatus Limnocylindrales bacterium]